MQIPASIVQSFQNKFGQAPTLLVRAPGRINLIGEHTDYNKGFVLPAAIDRAIWIAIVPRADNQLHFFAHDLNENFDGDLKNLERSSLGWPNYLLGCFSELIKEGYDIQGADLVFGGDIPLGAGLSSSAAIESGLLFALNEHYHLGIQRPDLARLAQNAENNFVGMKCGIMDMYASLLGKKGFALKLDCRTLECEYIPLNAGNTAIVLCDTGVKHQLVNSEYNTRRLECEAGVQQLHAVYPSVQSLRDVTLEMLGAQKDQLPETVYKRCRFVVEENQRVEKACLLLKENGLSAIGSLLYASHEGLRQQYEVSGAELDFLVDHTPDSLSFFGARMIGGGFGGCTLNLMDQNAVPGFKNNISKKYHATFGRELRIWEVKITDGVSIESSNHLPKSPWGSKKS